VNTLSTVVADIVGTPLTLLIRFVLEIVRALS
jgi:hypothetical protein